MKVKKQIMTNSGMQVQTKDLVAVASVEAADLVSKISSVVSSVAVAEGKIQTHRDKEMIYSIQ